jgi:hypothetical protein
MKYIESWLTGLGLESIIPKLEQNGITTPKKLAALTLKDMCDTGMSCFGVLLHGRAIYSWKCNLFVPCNLKHAQNEIHLFSNLVSVHNIL